MNVEGAGTSVNVGATPFADSEDGCRRLPWFCKWCSNRVALGVIVGLVFTVALLASFLVPLLDAAKAGTTSDIPRNAVLDNSATFLAIGDWGQRGSREQTAVAKAMATWAAAVNASFIVSVGDNFYWNGVENTSDPQFDESWRLVYAAPGLQRPWLALFGKGGARQAQLEGDAHCFPVAVMVAFTQATTTTWATSVRKSRTMPTLAGQRSRIGAWRGLYPGRVTAAPAWRAASLQCS